MLVKDKDTTGGEVGEREKSMHDMYKCIMLHATDEFEEDDTYQQQLYIYTKKKTNTSWCVGWRRQKKQKTNKTKQKTKKTKFKYI